MRRTLLLRQNMTNLLVDYAQQRAQPVTFSDLTKYSTALPLSQSQLLESAEQTRLLLLAGLARRVTDHLSLPFLPATNPSLQSIYSLYASAFAAMSELPPITSLEENDKLCKAMASMVEAHRDNIPILAKGFQESRRYLTDERITAFLNRAIKNRISLRLRAEQHLSISELSLPSLRAAASSSSSSSSSRSSPSSSSAQATTTPTTNGKGKGKEHPTKVGVLDLALNPSSMVTSCASFVTSLCDATYGISPAYEIEGVSATVPVGSISAHLEYILTELLKNAFRATVEHHSPRLLREAKERERALAEGNEEEDDGRWRFKELPMAHLEKSDFPKVLVSIGVVPGVLTIRIRDRGGGIAPENISNVFSYAFTTVARQPDPDADPDSPSPSTHFTSLDDDSSGYYGTGGIPGGGGGDGHGNGEGALRTELGTLAGLGFGLPLSRLYANYFGGSLDLVSMYGWGTDVYVVLRTV